MWLTFELSAILRPQEYLLFHLMASKITQKHIQELVAKYDPRKITIGVLGGHSALDVCQGVKKFGFKTLVIAQKGREKTYTEYYKVRSFWEDKKLEEKEESGCCGGGCGDEGGGCGDSDDKSGDFQVGCVDEVIVVDTFSDITNPALQERLRKMNVIFVHNRYFWVYCDFEKIEKEFFVPIYGNREAVKLEERDQPKNQYWLLKEAGIRIPKIFGSYKEIDRLAIVKVNEATRGYERAFFLASTPEQCLETAKKMVKEDKITMEAFEKATIEEYVLGAHVNLNFFYSPLVGTNGRLELMGTDTRRQTNLDGFLRLPADQQLEVLKLQQPKMIETGHYAVTMKESLIEKAYEIGEKFVKIMAKEVPPGMVGPFALQGAVVAENGKEEFVIFDVSMRIPGSPGTKSTPYSSYLFGDSLSYGERIGIELRSAINTNKLDKLVS